MSFIEKLERRQKSIKSLLCIGLDPSIEKLPKCVSPDSNGIFEFNRTIIDSTARYACAYKPQIAYYSAIGAEKALESTIQHIHSTYPDIPVILDAKRNDIGSTAEMYAKEAFVRYEADAVTVNPFLGIDTVKPFADWTDKGVVLLCKTSNPSSSELQDLIFDNKTLYMHIAEKALAEWNYNNNILFVVGATYPSQMHAIRSIAPNSIFLVPGLGFQGGSIVDCMENGLRKDGLGLLLSASRSIIHASIDDKYYEASEKVAQTYQMEMEDNWKA